METPVPRMTRSRARGLATPATGVPGARKAAVTVLKTMTTSKGKLQAEPSDDVIPFAALSTDQGEAEPGEPEFEVEQGNLGSSVGSPSKTTESQPAPQSDQALASPEPSEVDLAPLLVVGSMQIEEPMQPEDKSELFSNTAAAEPQGEFVSSGAAVAGFASEVELSLGDCSVEGTPEVSNEGAEGNTDMPEDGELAEEQHEEEQPLEGEELVGEELEAEADMPVAEVMALPADQYEEPFNTDEVPLPSELDDELLEDAPFSSEIGVPAESTEVEMQEDAEDLTTLPSAPASPGVAADSPCLSPPSSPVAAAPALALASPPASPLAAAPRITSQGLSKTPGPKASSRAVPAKHSLSAVKPASATPVFSRLMGRDSSAPTPSAAAPAALGVRFTTPVKLATTTPAKASTATLKAALKPSSTFGTPGTATKKTSEGAAPIRSVKRVSISTPVHPKSETAQRHIVRTPFPRSGGPKVLPEDEDLGSEEDQEMEAGGNVTVPLPTPDAPAEDAGSDDADMGELQTDMLAKDSDLSSEEQEEPNTEATEDMAVDAPVLKHATTPAVVPARSPLPAATTSSRLSPLPAPVETRPAGLSSAKRAQGAEALKSRARAEMGYAAQQAARPSPTPGSSSGATVPSYMAPTTARMFKMKSVAVLPENHDTTSLREIKRQLKEATAKKAATVTAKEPLKMSDVRKPRLVTKATRGDSPEPSENYDDDEAQHDPAAEELLMKAMTKLEIAKPTAKIAPLKGLPAPQGKHIRFTAKGKPVESPSNTRPVLRGVPPAAGTHLRFSE